MKNVFLPMFLLLSATLFGQRSAEVGIFLGASNYQGDFAKTPISFNETGMVFGAMYQRFIDPQWGIKGSATYGQLSGKDSNLGSVIQRDRDWAFTANVFEVAGHLQFHPWGQSRFNGIGTLQSHISPYVSVGLGLAFAQAKVTTPADDKFKLPEPGDRDVFFSVPISAGIRYVMTKKLTLTGEFGQRATFSDYLDGLSKNGNPDAKDWYMFVGLGLTYTLFAEY